MIISENRMKKIYLILLLGFSLRILIIPYYLDLKKNSYFEYGEIAKNIVHGNGFSLFYMNNSGLDYHYNPEIKASESAYMSPGYVYFLVPFMSVNDIELRNILIVLFQMIISTLTIFLIYRLTLELFTEKTALIAATIIASNSRIYLRKYLIYPNRSISFGDCSIIPAFNEIR